MSARKKIMFVFGTRPEAIKLAPVIKEVSNNSKQFEVITVATGQHRQMLDQVLKAFKIKPDHDLEIMQKGQSLSDITEKSIKGLNDFIRKIKPDMVVVQGDTSTTFAAGLAAFYNKVKVAHVEAGLRTWNKYQPYPEEMNRKLTSVIADLHFAPTITAAGNLRSEGILNSTIFITGNTVVDALLEVAKEEFDLASLGLNLSEKEKIILVTTHRRESFGEPLKNILKAVREISEKHSEKIRIIIPVHKNPEVESTVKEMLKGLSNATLIEPLDYIPFVHLMKSSYLILTDSGGIQEEAPSLGKPVLVLREVTERPEGVQSGVVRLVGTKTNSIVSEANKLLVYNNEYEKMSKRANPYGDGFASQRIVKGIQYYFGLIDKRPENFLVRKKIKEPLVA